MFSHHSFISTRLTLRIHRKLSKFFFETNFFTWYFHLQKINTKNLLNVPKNLEKYLNEYS